MEDKVMCPQSHYVKRTQLNPTYFFKERNDGFGGRWYLLNEFLEDEPILVLTWLTWAGHF